MKPTMYLDIPTIGVTGSFGKTTVKEITASILATKYNTYKSPKNFNLPNKTREHVEDITDKHEAVVIEMAMSKKGRGKKQCTVIQPSIGVITAIGHAHFERFSSIEDVAKSKSEMMKYMKQDGILLLNNDDDNSKLINTKYFPGKIIKVGRTAGSDYVASNISYNRDGMTFDVKLNGKSESMFINLLGEHSVINSLFGIAIADQLDVTADQIREGLKEVNLPRGRLTVDNFEGNRTLVDDSYNANPASMISGLNVLNDFVSSKRKSALLGDMVEMGNYTKEGHEKVGSSLVNYNLDQVYLFGESSKYIREKAIEVGFPKEKLIHYDDIEQLINAINEAFSEDTALLVKASRATNLKRVVDFLLKNYKSIH